MKISVFVPSHITGFFTIANDNSYLKKGSCGCGILIDKGVKTTIKTSKCHEKVDIKINGEEDPKNSTISKKVLDLIKNDFHLESGLKISHDIEVPIGCGFGTSASCALGIAIDIFKLLDLPISYTKTLQYAHKAETELGSGLGDVIAETSKGIVLRKKPGAPGIGEVESIDLQNSSDLHVISKTCGEINTKTIIQDHSYQKKINQVGIAIQKKFTAKPCVNSFLDCSREFAEKTNLINEDVREIISRLNDYTLGASMAMLGNTAFALSKDDYCDEKGAIVSKVDVEGIRFLKKDP